MRKHLLKVAYFDCVVGSKVHTVYFDYWRVSINETPHVELLNIGVEATASFVVERALLLNRNHGQYQKIRSAYDVSLESYVEDMISFWMSLCFLISHSDLLIVVFNVEWLH